LVKAKDVTEVLRNAMRINVHRTGIEASEVSASSLLAGGEMALIHGSEQHVDDGLMAQ
jgi:hypothetical protein